MPLFISSFSSPSNRKVHEALKAEIETRIGTVPAEAIHGNHPINFEQGALYCAHYTLRLVW